VTKGYVPQCIQ